LRIPSWGNRKLKKPAGLEHAHWMEGFFAAGVFRTFMKGPDVKKNMTRTIRQGDEYVARVKRYPEEEEGDPDRVTDRVKSAEWDPKPLPKQPLEAYMMSTKTRIRSIRKHMADSP
jgi:hypothetical protein